eukprot:XP_011664973.1 PREDICTED: fibronectin-like [Strongylocentrotus purpuratus]
MELSTAQIPGPVQNLVINNIQQWGFTAAWDPPNTGNTPEFYNVTITNTNTNDVYERSLLPNDDGAYEIDHLYDDTTYMFSVVAVNSDGQGGLAVENTGINIPPCQLCLSSANSGSNFFQLLFPATGVTTILSGTSVDASSELTVTPRAIGPTLTSIFYLGLQGGLLYELQMTDSNTQDIVYSSRYRTVPNPATNLLLSPDSSTSVQVTYEQPIGTQYHKYDGFRITYGDQERFVGSSDTSVVIDGLQAGISYTFEVQTFSGELADRTYSMPATDDIILVDLFLEANATTSLSVAWALPSIEVSGFQIRYSILDASSFTTLPFGATVTSAILENLEPGKIYRINLYIVTAEGTDLLTGAEFQTTPLLYVQGHHLNSRTAHVSFYHPHYLCHEKGKVRYRFLRLRVRRRSQGLDTGPDGDEFLIPTDACPEYTFNNLLPDTDYAVDVNTVAEDERTESSPSTMDVTTPPMQEGEISFNGITTTSINFSWGMVSADTNGPFDFYLLNLKNELSIDIHNVQVNTSETREHTFSGLMPGRLYRVELIVNSFRQRSAAMYTRKFMQ